MRLSEKMRPLGRLAAHALAMAVALVALALVFAIPSPAGTTDSREEYVVALDKICKRDQPRSEGMVRKANRLFDKRKYAQSARTLTRAGKIMDRTLKRMKAVEPPAQDRRTVTRWLNQLTTQSKLLKQIAGALRRQNRSQVLKLQTRVMHSSNAANNTVFLFEFKHCLIVPGAYL